jgi:hypothetical protein
VTLAGDGFDGTPGGPPATGSVDWLTLLKVTVLALAVKEKEPNAVSVRGFQA